MKRMHAVPGSLYALCIACALATGPATAAVDISLDMNSLPSAQGWTYFSGGGVPESTMFSLNSGVLTANSIGLPGRGNEYDLIGVVDPALSFLLEFRARVIQEENISGIYWGFGVIVFNGAKFFSLGIGTSTLYTVGGGSGTTIAVGLDNTQFHTYRVEGLADGQYSIFRDNLLQGSDVAINYSFNSLSLGDVTGDATAHAELTSFRFTQPAPVPEPAAWLLMAGGLALLGIRLRQARGKA